MDSSLVVVVSFRTFAQGGGDRNEGSGEEIRMLEGEGLQ